MKLYIIRHAKVLMKWSRMSDSCVFDEECDEYDNSPIDTSKIIPADISVKRVYCSESRRSRETARFSANSDFSPIDVNVKIRIFGFTRLFWFNINSGWLNS